MFGDGGRALPPGRAATAARDASSFLETTANLQPLSASRWDTAAPIPLEPPHTTASRDGDMTPPRQETNRLQRREGEVEEKPRLRHFRSKQAVFSSKIYLIQSNRFLTLLLSHLNDFFSAENVFIVFKNSVTVRTFAADRRHVCCGCTAPLRPLEGAVHLHLKHLTRYHTDDQ